MQTYSAFEKTLPKIFIQRPKILSSLSEEKNYKQQLYINFFFQIVPLGRRRVQSWQTWWKFFTPSPIICCWKIILNKKSSVFLSEKVRQISPLDSQKVFLTCLLINFHSRSIFVAKIPKNYEFENFCNFFA